MMKSARKLEIINLSQTVANKGNDHWTCIAIALKMHLIDALNASNALEITQKNN